MRRAARVDSNHAVIVGGLRACGATVQSLASVGAGCPDLLVGHRGRNLLIEIKDGRRSPSKRSLTPDQVTWHRDWNGAVIVVESVEQAVAALATIPNRDVELMGTF
jgi:hypothetical protein